MPARASIRSLTLSPPKGASRSGCAFASPGVGTTNHLAMEGLAIAAGIKLFMFLIGAALRPRPLLRPATFRSAASRRSPAKGCSSPAGSEGGCPDVLKGAAVTRARIGRRSPMPGSTSMPRSGSACSRRPARLPRSSTSSMRRRNGFSARADTQKQLIAVGRYAPVSQAAFAERNPSDAARYAAIIEKTGLRPPQP